MRGGYSRKMCGHRGQVRSRRGEMRRAGCQMRDKREVRTGCEVWDKREVRPGCEMRDEREVRAGCEVRDQHEVGSNARWSSKRTLKRA
jgi:hypothetical protein